MGDIVKESSTMTSLKFKTKSHLSISVAEGDRDDKALKRVEEHVSVLVSRQKVATPGIKPYVGFR